MPVDRAGPIRRLRWSTNSPPPHLIVLPGTGHPKRYLGTSRELLSARIRRLSAVNIQHIEASTTFVVNPPMYGCRETVPDSGVSTARTRSNLIDLSARLPDPSSLDKGGQCLCAQASRGARSIIFSPANSDSLRNLALLRHRPERVRPSSCLNPMSRPMRSPVPWAAGRAHPGLPSTKIRARGGTGWRPNTQALA